MQEPTDWLKNLGSENVLSDAQRVMKSAFEVLEEEVAAGILAAKKMEKKILEQDIEADQDPQNLLNRVRTDMHEAVDLVMDSVIALTKHFGRMTGSLGSTVEAPAQNREATIPTFKNGLVAKPGELLLIPMQPFDPSAGNAQPSGWHASDLLGPDDKKIRAQNISFLLIPTGPDGSPQLAIQVAIPKSCTTGVYAGLVQSSLPGEMRGVLMVDVSR